MKLTTYLGSLVLLCCVLMGCKTDKTTDEHEDIIIHNDESFTGDKLPVLGFPRTVEEEVDGKMVEKQVEYTVADFEFMNQDSNVVTAATFEDKIYVTDFFFTTCPSICPIMKKQMLRLYEHFEDEPSLKFLSHSIDAATDSIPRLKQYADDMLIETDRWHLVTGPYKDIKRMAKEYIIADIIKDPSLPGGYDHSGHFVLVDKKRRVRAFCHGTDEKSVDKFIGQIELLLKEYKTEG